jgi:hypothetical protein
MTESPRNPLVCKPARVFVYLALSEWANEYAMQAGLSWNIRCDNREAIVTECIDDSCRPAALGWPFP